MLSVLEGWVQDNFKSVNKWTDMILSQIFQKMDIIYRVPTTFQNLNTTL